MLTELYIYLVSQMSHISLKHGDLNSIANVGRGLTGLSCVNDVGDRALELLMTLFRADKSNFFLDNSDKQRQNLKFVAAKGCDEKHCDDFLSHYYKVDPFGKLCSMAKARPRGSIICVTDQLVSYNDFLKSEIYNDFFRPQNVLFKLCIYLRFGTSLGVVGLLRNRNRQPFSDNDRAKAQLVAPYLTAALEKAFALEQKELVIQSIEQEITHKGIMILNQELVPVHINNAAHKIISLLGSDEKDKSPLCQFLYQLHKELKKRRNYLSLDNTKDFTTDQRLFDLVSMDKAYNISVRMRLMPTLQRDEFIFVTMETEELEIHRDDSPKQPKLSKREMEVASAVCEGLTNAQIAQKLFISEFTVITHLRVIYEKLKVNNRTSLARLIFQSTMAANG